MIDIAGRYAEALLTAAKEQDALETVTGELAMLAGAFSPYAKVFAAPVFPAREQHATVEAVLGGDVHPLTKGFFELLVTMRRLGNIAHIAAVFDRLARAEMGRVDLSFTVFEQPAPELAERLIKAAEDVGLVHTRDRSRVEPHYRVDKGLLGGFVAECGGVSWDCSLRARMNKMAKELRKA
jgi:F-type H+-transporting ATPase subunit delta